MKKAINIFQYATIVIGFIVIVIFLIPRLFGIKPYIVLSGSMEPKIKTGAVAYIDTKVDVKEIKEGDIIAFNIGAKQVTHRVVEINNDRTFTTKGDANKVIDMNRVKFSSYIGKTIFSIPYLGYVLAAIQTKLGYSILIAVIGINIITIILFDGDKKHIKESKAKLKRKNKKNILKHQNI